MDKIIFCISITQDRYRKEIASMKKILITGISGFLGYTMAQSLYTQYKIYGIYNRHSVTINTVTTFRVDCTTYSDCRTCIDLIQPDFLIHTAAIAQPNICQQQPKESYNINVEAPYSLAGICAERNIDFAFISTDLVFDGTDAPYSENDPVSPISIYGEQKVRAEQKIRSCHPDAVICRMPLMYGLPSPHSSSFIQPIIQSITTQKKISLFFDEFRTPVSSKSATEGIVLAFTKFRGETIHLGGRDSISRYECGLLLAQILKVPENLVMPIEQSSIAMAAPRPKNVSLSSLKAYNAGYNPQTLKDSFLTLIG